MDNLVLFGAGQKCLSAIDQDFFRNDVVVAIVDSDKGKWGIEIPHRAVESPRGGDIQ